MKAIFYNDFKNAHIPEIFKEIYLDAVYSSYFQGKKDVVVADVGANIGLFSQYASPYASKVFAVEPSAVHQECLCELKRFNNLENIQPIQVALSHQNGTANFYHNQNVTMYSLKPEVNSLPEQMEEVRTVTFDKLFELMGVDHIDFLKIDIEGSEAEVFGSEGFEKVKDKIDVIMGEFHVWSGVNPKQFESYFRDRGFKFQWEDSTEATLFTAERIT